MSSIVYIEVVSKDENVPRRSHADDAGLDLHAAINEVIQIEPGGRAKIPTGVSMAIPPGYHGMICPRSGFADRLGLTVLNAPGIVDSGYRGEVCVLLVNHGKHPIDVQPCARIAQIVFVRNEKAIMIRCTSLDDTDRGESGFGGSGV